jgi:hypothetical protein
LITLFFFNWTGTGTIRSFYHSFSIIVRCIYSFYFSNNSNNKPVQQTNTKEKIKRKKRIKRNNEKDTMSFSKKMSHSNIRRWLCTHIKNDELVLKGSSSWANKSYSEPTWFQRSVNSSCGRVLYIRAKRKVCKIPGNANPCSHRERVLVSERPSIRVTYFWEYPLHCLNSFNLFEVRLRSIS